MTELRFDGRVVVVTGAGRGVGRSHALMLAGKGARVVVADYGVGIDGVGSSSAPADDVVAETKAAGGDAVACFAARPLRPGCRFAGARVLPAERAAPADWHGKRLAHRRGAVTGNIKSTLTAEDIAENLDQIVDLADAQVTESNRSVL